MSKIIRTHDDFYLKDQRKQNTKKYFKFLLKILRKNKITQSEGVKIIDIGWHWRANILFKE